MASADAACSSANALLAAGNQAQAERLIRQYLGLYPNNQKLWFMHACCMRSRDMVSRSRRVFAKVVSLGDKTPYGKCSKYVMMLDVNEGVKTNIIQLHKLTDEIEGDILPRWMLARQYYEHGMYDDAIRQYKLILKIWDPGPVLIHQILGNIFEIQGRLDEALKERQLTVRLEQASYSYYGLGTTLTKLGRYSEANEAFARSMSYDQKSASGWAAWANNMLIAGQVSNAVTKCEMALKVDPNHCSALYIYGKCLYEMGNYDDAIEMYKKVISLEPSAETYYVLAVTFNHAKKYDEACDAFEKSAEIDQSSGRLWSDWAWTLLQKREYDEAVGKCEKAVAIDPNDGYTWFYWGACLERKGELEAALVKYKRGAELSPHEDYWLERYTDLEQRLRGNSEK